MREIKQKVCGITQFYYSYAKYDQQFLHLFGLIVTKVIFYENDISVVSVNEYSKTHTEVVAEKSILERVSVGNSCLFGSLQRMPVWGLALGENQLKTHCFWIENPKALKISSVDERFSSNIPHSKVSKRIRELSYQILFCVSCMVASRIAVSNHFQTNVESTGNRSPLKP